MVFRFNIPCSFGSKVSNVDFFVGTPREDQHPINFQAKWLGENRGGTVPASVMDSIKKIKEIADKEHVSFEHLCLYTVNLANGISQGENKEFNKLLIKYDDNNQQPGQITQ
ncbi:MAG: DUF2610 domain-containing protein [Rickettsiales bacterium]|jgi:hypothetical protein|nr:DUF2610 domain-containing protein [Rickettsiales bacterium]